MLNNRLRKRHQTQSRRDEALDMAVDDQLSFANAGSSSGLINYQDGCSIFYPGRKPTTSRFTDGDEDEIS